MSSHIARGIQKPFKAKGKRPAGHSPAEAVDGGDGIRGDGATMGDGVTRPTEARQRPIPTVLEGVAPGV